MNKTQEEILESLKGYWKTYGTLVILTVMITMVVVAGWQYRQHQQARRLEQASFLLQRWLNEKIHQPVNAHGHVQPSALTKQLVEHYAFTPYAVFAHLALAEEAVQTRHFKAAERELALAMARSRSSELSTIIRLRKARMLCFQQSWKRALAVLDAVNNPAFSVQVNLLRGQIYQGLHQSAAAEKSFRLVLAKLTPDHPLYAQVLQSLLQM